MPQIPGLRTRTAFTLLLCGMVAAACTARPVTGGHVRGGQVVSAERIAELNARTAWDALRMTVAGVTFLEAGRTSAPARVRRRGTSSLVLGDHPLIYIDEVRISDLGVLRSMPATDLESIRVLSGIDATTYYGTNAGDGVILLRTRTSVRD